MSTAVVMERSTEASPRFKARAAGVFYLLTFVTGIFELVFVSGRQACYIWRRRGYSDQHPGARAFISTWFRMQSPRDRVLCRCDGSLLQPVQAGGQEPLGTRRILQPRGMRHGSC